MRGRRFDEGNEEGGSAMIPGNHDRARAAQFIKSRMETTLNEKFLMALSVIALTRGGTVLPDLLNEREIE